MDDDCIPESDTLQGLLEGLVLVPEKPVGVLQSYQKGWNNHSRPAKIAKSISEFIYFALKGGCTVPVVMGERSPIAIDWFQLVSVLIARSAVEKVGFPRKELFLYADDTDYAYRIGQAGFHMYLIPWSIVNHIGGKSVEASAGSIPNWRWYYIYRNQIATVLYNREHLNYLNVFIALLRTSGKAVLMVAMSLMVRNISKSKYVGLGLLDGYYLRLGKTVQPQRKL
jgi:GT2 family glycosyltransferase